MITPVSCDDGSALGVPARACPALPVASHLPDTRREFLVAAGARGSHKMGWGTLNAPSSRPSPRPGPRPHSFHAATFTEIGAGANLGKTEPGQVFTKMIVLNWIG